MVPRDGLAFFSVFLFHFVPEFSAIFWARLHRNYTEFYLALRVGRAHRYKGFWYDTGIDGGNFRGVAMACALLCGNTVCYDSLGHDNLP